MADVTRPPSTCPSPFTKEAGLLAKPFPAPKRNRRFGIETTQTAVYHTSGGAIIDRLANRAVTACVAESNEERTGKEETSLTRRPDAMKTLLVLAVLCCVGCGESQNETAQQQQPDIEEAELPAEILKSDLDAAKAKLTVEDVEIIEAKIRDTLRRINTGELVGRQATAARIAIDQLALDLAAKH